MSTHTAAEYDRTAVVAPHHPAELETDPIPSESVDHLVALYGLFRQALAVGGPDFGTPEWLALEASDPRREAALIRTSYTWVAAELGLGAPADRDRLDRLVREEVSAVLIATSAEVAIGRAELREARRFEARRPVRAAIEYPPRWAA